MLGLPHHQPVFGQSRLPSSAPTKPSPKAQTTPVDVTTDVAPDIMEGKNVDDVVPAPVPPADPPTDPAPVPPPSEQRIDAGEPAPEDPFFPAEEQAAEPLSTEESQKLAPKPVPEIQPIALWIPETRRPVIRPAVKPTRKVEASEIVVLPGTRMSSKRIQ